MKIHELKIDPEHLAGIFECEKTFELRKNDRNFREGDVLHLRRYKEISGYDGTEALVVVTSLLDDHVGIRKGYCIMSVRQIL